MPRTIGTDVLRHADSTLSTRLAESARATGGVATSPEQFEKWFAERCAAQVHEVNRIPFSRLRNWSFAENSGHLVHDTGRFFTVAGLKVEVDEGPVKEWSQPIIVQREIGLLGIAVREIDGVLHLLMQAKAEPGNPNGVQLSPTVQATKSNYTGVHQGRLVPYVKHFAEAEPRSVVADVLQSEHGAWFYRKRNRNMVIEVGPEVEAGEDFCWLTLGQVQEQLRIDHRVNMDTRTVLSCLPGFGDDGERGGLHTETEILSWITSNQAVHDVDSTVVGLRDLPGWRQSDWSISHESGLFFSVTAVDVVANSREVGGWTQPLFEPHGVGIAALLVKRFGGVLHVLLRARIEPGYIDAIELAPTVQGTPENHARLGGAVHEQLLDIERRLSTDRVLYDAEMSEEGGRFHHSRSRYMIIEVGDDHFDEEPPGFRWMTRPQITWLLQHRHYLNVQARSLIACLHACAD
ncbi:MULTISPECIES: NDP-hexose 2,3-dehydratase family protein [unclassified Streptomyces]|uniref:NDP-hexose 2,3-dehydratase family protein n=1 Tax=unclassified Streptomyces TaxID=2593676 RepID=UPI0003775D32|nr:MULTISPECIES: NDP-hexose 2,3-dehydratase family protein [unclassified Streptomyces]MYY03367.1 NDP-hexose 2,3-dehydratase [Streptomyces sp. SID4913]